MAPLRVLIVDDEEDMRALVRAMIEVADQGLSVAGEAPDGEAAVGLCREVHPQLVLLDQRMPGPSGLETAERILAEDPTQMIVLLSGFLDRQVVGAAKRIGVHACVSKRDLHDLPETLRGLASQPGAN